MAGASDRLRHAGQAPQGAEGESESESLRQKDRGEARTRMIADAMFCVAPFFSPELMDFNSVFLSKGGNER